MKPFAERDRMLYNLERGVSTILKLHAKLPLAAFECFFVRMPLPDEHQEIFIRYGPYSFIRTLELLICGQEQSLEALTDGDLTDAIDICVSLKYSVFKEIENDSI
jgi:hypothetical protein